MMGGVVLVARVVLAVVFGVAAVGKLLDLPGARRAVAGFGVPERAVGAVALFLPVVELATAVALVLRPSARWGAVAAVCLLVVFVAAIGRAMVRGVAPDCHCFGQLASRPAGGRTLIRNALLAAPAVLVVAYGPGEGVDQWVSGRSAAELGAAAAGVCAVALAVVVAWLWRENRRLDRENRRLLRYRDAEGLLPPGLPVGVAAPGFSLPGADGAGVELGALLGGGRPVALVFVGPRCGPCAALFPDLARWQTALSQRITIALLSSGSVPENQAVRDGHGLENVLADDDGEVFTAYRVSATPSVVVVAPDGRIASRTHSARAMTETVIRNALHSDHPTPPALSVVTVNGNH
jgi:peroxiredoxin/uncharacterized membrane protein YphA (DoxX/SURF4 family)